MSTWTAFSGRAAASQHQQCCVWPTSQRFLKMHFLFSFGSQELNSGPRTYQAGAVPWATSLAIKTHFTTDSWSVWLLFPPFAVKMKQYSWRRRLSEQEGIPAALSSVQHCLGETPPAGPCPVTSHGCALPPPLPKHKGRKPKLKDKSHGDVKHWRDERFGVLNSLVPPKCLI